MSSNAFLRKRLKLPRFAKVFHPGAVPGTIARPHVEIEARPRIEVIAYGPDDFFERDLTDEWTQKQDLRDAFAQAQRDFPVVWINIDGVGDAALLRHMAEIFDIHPLAVEDIAHVHQLGKVEDYSSNLFIVARMAHAEAGINTEQVSLVLGNGYVLTFQERVGDCFDPVRRRIEDATSRAREAGADYLAYVLLDTLIDHYFPVVDGLADRLDDLEGALGHARLEHVNRRIHTARGELLSLRRAVRPHREAINQLIRGNYPQITENTRVYLRDTYDHIVQLIELLETYREVCTGLHDFHLSLVSNRMNEIMKVLTIISTVFIPLSFVAGLYGMNFDTDSKWNMPELGWEFGYPITLAAMTVVAVAMLFFFWRHGWIGDHNGFEEDK